MISTVPPSDGQVRDEAAAVADKHIVMEAWDEWKTERLHEDLPEERPDLHLQSLTHDPLDVVMPGLTEAIDRASGWVLDRHMASAFAVELRIELQIRALIEMYAALVSSGIELTRESHLLLTERCTCRQFLRTREERSAIITIRLELTCMADVAPEPDLFALLNRTTATA